MSNVSSQLGFVGLVESLMVFCDMVPRHLRLTTTIATQYGAVSVSGPKHFKRIISNSSQLIHTRGQMEPCNCVRLPQSFTSCQPGVWHVCHRIQTLHQNKLL
jgi:hypothetical protein